MFFILQGPNVYKNVQGNMFFGYYPFSVAEKNSTNIAIISSLRFILGTVYWKPNTVMSIYFGNHKRVAVTEYHDVNLFRVP